MEEKRNLSILAMRPVLIKVGIMVCMVTLAMSLIDNGIVAGYIVYIKEICEFVAFVMYAFRERERCRK